MKTLFVGISGAEAVRTSPSPSVPPPPPPDSRCLVCRDRNTFAVCRNLTDGVQIIMEAVGAQIKISKSGCPELPSDDSPQWQLLVVCTVAIVLIIAALAIYWKCCRNVEESESHRGDGPVALTDQTS